MRHRDAFQNKNPFPNIPLAIRCYNSQLYLCSDNHIMPSSNHTTLLFGVLQLLGHCSVCPKGLSSHFPTCILCGPNSTHYLYPFSVPFPAQCPLWNTFLFCHCSWNLQGPVQMLHLPCRIGLRYESVCSKSCSVYIYFTFLLQRQRENGFM